MRPLTEHTPKPLLQVGGAALIAHHLARLAAAGFTEVVINVSHLGQQILDFCGDGQRWGLRIAWSPEPEPLETAGGIVQALPLLGGDPFLLVNGDIWTDCAFDSLASISPPGDRGAYLVVVGNPPHHPRGDFRLHADGRLTELAPGQTGSTYAGVGVYSVGFFAGCAPGKRPMLPLLVAAIERGELSGEFHAGDWEDVGTPERLRALDLRLRSADKQ